jgi:hypothetical protein
VLARTTCGVKEYSTPKLWTISIGYRYQQSFRHFVGTVEQKQREINRNQIYNLYHLVDVGIERQLTRRWSARASVPLIFSHRNQLYAPSGRQVVNGIGDASFGVRSWIFKPPTESGDNISVGVSLKVPTGDYRATTQAVRAGQVITASNDVSMMLGDGGTGFAVDIEGYKRVPFQTMLYGGALWLFNPRNTNGVSTFRNGRGEEVFSVADQYLFRGGAGHAIPWIRGLAGTFGVRMEGVPVRDVFGKSLGFRRPGYALSLDPGLTYARGLYTFSINGPWAIQRNRRASVPDITRGAHGDAAFADYTILFGLSRRF